MAFKMKGSTHYGKNPLKQTTALEKGLKSGKEYYQDEFFKEGLWTTKSGKGNIFTKGGRNQRLLNKLNRVDTKLRDASDKRYTRKYKRLRKRKQETMDKIGEKGFDVKRMGEQGLWNKKYYYNR